MVESLHVAASILEAAEWWDMFPAVERSALGLSVFLHYATPEGRPDVKYQKVLEAVIKPSTPQTEIALLARVLVRIGSDETDLLKRTPENLIVELLEAVLAQSPPPQHRAIAHFHSIREKLDVESSFHAQIVSRLIGEAARFPMLFAPPAAIQRALDADPSRTASLIVHSKPIILPLVKELSAFCASFRQILERVESIVIQ
jgi:hypothetical protein